MRGKRATQEQKDQIEFLASEGIAPDVIASRVGVSLPIAKKYAALVDVTDVEPVAPEMTAEDYLQKIIDAKDEEIGRLNSIIEKLITR